MAPDGYLRGILADGARSVRHRSGVRDLLGLPDVGARIEFPRKPRGSGFVYHRPAGTPPAPDGTATVWHQRVVDDFTAPWSDTRPWPPAPADDDPWSLDRPPATGAAGTTARAWRASTEPAEPAEPAGPWVGRDLRSALPATSPALPLTTAPEDAPQGRRPDQATGPLSSSVVEVPGITARPGGIAVPDELSGVGHEPAPSAARRPARSAQPVPGLEQRPGRVRPAATEEPGRGPHEAPWATTAWSAVPHPGAPAVRPLPGAPAAASAGRSASTPYLPTVPGRTPAPAPASPGPSPGDSTNGSRLPSPHPPPVRSRGPTTPVLGSPDPPLVTVDTPRSRLPSPHPPPMRGQGPTTPGLGSPDPPPVTGDTPRRAGLPYRHQPLGQDRARLMATPLPPPLREEAAPPLGPEPTHAAPPPPPPFVVAVTAPASSGAAAFWQRRHVGWLRARIPR
jgi:hypothetical protein